MADHRNWKNPLTISDPGCDDMPCMDLTDEEAERITGILPKYVVPAPDEKRIDQTVTALTYMLKNVKVHRNPVMFLTRYMAIVSHVMKYSGKWYIMLCLILYSSALAITLRDNNINPCVPSMVLGPVPFLLAIVSAFKNSRIQMAELEMSFKYSLKQLLMAKFLLAAILNTVCNTILSLAVTQTYSGLNPPGLTLYWCVPFILVSSISLYISLKIRSFSVSLGCLGIWSALSVAVAVNPGLFRFLTECVKTEIYVAVIIISGLVLIYDITFLLTNTIERGEFLDTYSGKHIKTV